ncbi:MAG TPA: polyprenyl diphosphate synthase, partial [Longimicrobiales bacterium]|nr:polyprenyl diphosphate synthase [Longimicrobiales bacterium]
RWAKSRGLPRFRGHSAGMQSVRNIVEAAVEIGIPYLTLYAFSQENWNRPAAEVGALMRLLQHYVRKERDELIRQGVEVRVFGDLERLNGAARKAVDHIQDRTKGGKNMRLNLMISYGSRDEILRATRNIAAKVQRGDLKVDQIDERFFSSELYTADVPDPDLLIRTSGEQRISNFLLWQLAYTELYITPTLWPDFARQDLEAAIHEYQKRERRFGRVTPV